MTLGIDSSVSVAWPPLRSLDMYTTDIYYYLCLSAPYPVEVCLEYHFRTPILTPVDHLLEYTTVWGTGWWCCTISSAPSPLCASGRRSGSSSRWAFGGSMRPTRFDASASSMTCPLPLASEFVNPIAERSTPHAARGRVSKPLSKTPSPRSRAHDPKHHTHLNTRPHRTRYHRLGVHLIRMHPDCAQTGFNTLAHARRMSRSRCRCGHARSERPRLGSALCATAAAQTRHEGRCGSRRRRSNSPAIPHPHSRTRTVEVGAACRRIINIMIHWSLAQLLVRSSARESLYLS